MQRWRQKLFFSLFGEIATRQGGVFIVYCKDSVDKRDFYFRRFRNSDKTADIGRELLFQFSLL